jgi:hypothetical protein
MRFLLCLASYRLSKWGKSCQAPFSGRISVFKEREVFWGTPLGAPIRNSLFHLENGKSVIVRTGLLAFVDEQQQAEVSSHDG